MMLNFGIAVTLTMIGILLFKFMWLRNDRYKLPDLEASGTDQEDGRPVNSFFEYASGIFKLIRTKNVQQFIRRFGFEYYFYLKFHQTMAISFVLSFLVMCATISVYSVLANNENGFTWRRIIGIYYEGSKAFPVLNTVIMVTISLIVTFNLRRMTISFQTALNDRVEEVQGEEEERRSSPRNQLRLHSDFSLIMNTALLYGCSSYDEEQKVLIPYLKRLIKEYRLDAHIQAHYSPSNHVELAKMLAQIKNTKLM